MRSSLLTLTILALAPACSSPQPAPSISDTDLRDPKAEFDVLRSLAGDWVAMGGGAKETDPFDVRFLVLDGGATVEAVMLGGASNDAVLTYRLEQNHITMIQRPSGGVSLSMPCEPIQVPVVVEWLDGGTWDSVTATYRSSGSGREVSRRLDPSIHMLGFKPADSAHVDWPQPGQLARAELDFSPEDGVGLAWIYADTIVQYHLTRKHPPGVERKADHSDPLPSLQDKMNRHFDLRDDPAYKAEPH